MIRCVKFCDYSDEKLLRSVEKWDKVWYNEDKIREKQLRLTGGYVTMCEEKCLEEMEQEVPVLFEEDIDILEDRLDDIIMAIGLPEEQTNAILRLISDALDEHHNNILDTYEELEEEMFECDCDEEE